MSKPVTQKLKSKHFRFITDDETGLPTVPPGIESDRALYALIVDWEGEGLPAYQEAGEDSSKSKVKA